MNESSELTIFIEWPDQPGGIHKASISRKNIEEFKQQSADALGLALGAIQGMANRVAQTLEDIEEAARPDEMEVEFAIKLDIEAGTILPMVAKTTTGGQFNVKFKWFIKPSAPGAG